MHDGWDAHDHADVRILIDGSFWMPGQRGALNLLLTNEVDWRHQPLLVQKAWQEIHYEKTEIAFRIHCNHCPGR